MLSSLCVEFFRLCLGFFNYIKLYINNWKHHSLYSEIKIHRTATINTSKQASILCPSSVVEQMIWFYHRARIQSNQINKIVATEAKGVFKLQTQKSHIHRYSFRAAASDTEINCIYLKPSDSTRAFISYKLHQKYTGQRDIFNRKNVN